MPHNVLDNVGCTLGLGLVGPKHSVEKLQVQEKIDDKYFGNWSTNGGALREMTAKTFVSL